jgi:hypothetical protein
VFLSAPQSDGYKLLARFGNEIQEVILSSTIAFLKHDDVALFK